MATLIITITDEETFTSRGKPCTAGQALREFLSEAGIVAEVAEVNDVPAQADDCSRVLSFAEQFLSDWKDNEGAPGCDGEVECQDAWNAYNRTEAAIRLTSAYKQAVADLLPYARSRAEDLSENAAECAGDRNLAHLASAARTDYLAADAAVTAAERLLDPASASIQTAAASAG